MKTVKEKTETYNKAAEFLGLPTVKQLRKTKVQTVDQRLKEIEGKAALKRLQEPEVRPTDTPEFIHTKPGTVMAELIQMLIEGATLYQLMLKFEHHSSSSLRAAIGHHVPKKGYVISRTKIDDVLHYKITNATEVK